MRCLPSQLARGGRWWARNGARDSVGEAVAAAAPRSDAAIGAILKRAAGACQPFPELGAGRASVTQPASRAENALRKSSSGKTNVRAAAESFWRGQREPGLRRRGDPLNRVLDSSPSLPKLTQPSLRTLCYAAAADSGVIVRGSVRAARRRALALGRAPRRLAQMACCKCLQLMPAREVLAPKAS